MPTSIDELVVDAPSFVHSYLPYALALSLEAAMPSAKAQEGWHEGERNTAIKVTQQIHDDLLENTTRNQRPTLEEGMSMVSQDDGSHIDAYERTKSHVLKGKELFSLRGQVREFLETNQKLKPRELIIEPSLMRKLQWERSLIDRKNPTYNDSTSPHEGIDSFLAKHLLQPMGRANRNYLSHVGSFEKISNSTLSFDQFKYGNIELGVWSGVSKHEVKGRSIVNEKHAAYFLRYKFDDHSSVYYQKIPDNSQGKPWDLFGWRGEQRFMTLFGSTPFETTVSGVIEVPFSRYTLLNNQAIWLPPLPTPSIEVKNQYMRVQAGTIPLAKTHYVQGEVHIEKKFDAFFNWAK